MIETVDFQCRYWFPRREISRRAPRVEDDWRWHRYAHTTHVDLPTFPGAHSMIDLPAPFFTFSAASLQRVELYRSGTGQLTVSLRLNNRYVIGPTEWRRTQLWTQLTFDEPDDDGWPHRGPWWLRYRTPGAGDLMSRMVGTLNTITAAVEHHGPPIGPTLAEVRDAAEEMRREILLWTLGGKGNR